MQWECRHLLYVRTYLQAGVGTPSGHYTRNCLVTQTLYWHCIVRQYIHLSDLRKAEMSKEAILTQFATTLVWHLCNNLV